ncbi:MAG: hypothetical protein H6732_02255 [Alphaproteobacteria bacterium]|nr:hypothetical protein [Alphaproteobacteria bacterium]
MRPSALLILPLLACARPPPAVGPPLPAPPVADPGVDPWPDHPLLTFFRALDEVDLHRPGAQAVVLHLGASHTASDTFTGPLRRTLQRRFGDAGRGYVAAGLPWRRFRVVDARVDASRRWTYPRGTRDDATGLFGVAGVRSEASRRGAWVRRATCEGCTEGATFDHVDVHALASPDAGSFRIHVDGALEATVHPVADEPGLHVTSLDLPDGPHEVEIEVVGDGPVALLGLQTTRAVPGVRYHNLGINGSRADHWLRMADPVIVAEVARLDPDLLVLHWGTNESTAYLPPDPATATPEDFARAARRQVDTYLQMLARLRAGAPHASCLLVLPSDLVPASHPALPGREDPCPPPETTPNDPEASALPPEDDAPLAPAPLCERPVPPSLTAIADAQREVARRAGCATWDTQAAMGGPGAGNRWRAAEPPLMRDDGIHPTFAGYTLLAEGLADDLLRTWEGWHTTPPGDTPLPTTPVAP